MRYAFAIIVLTLAFGCASPPAPAGPENVRALFCPQDACESELIEQIDSAQKSIHCAVYLFTLEDVREAIIRAEERGVDVKLVLETQDSESEWSQYPSLRDKVDVRLDGNQYLMHNKYCVFDGKIVWTGSYNWSKSGSERNNENVVILEDSKIAEEYESDFERLYMLAE